MKVGIHFLVPFFDENRQPKLYNEMLYTDKHPVKGEAITNANRMNAKAMVYLHALEPFVGA